MEYTINVTELQSILKEALLEDRNKAKGIGNQPVANAYLNGRMSICERVLVFLDKTIKQGEQIDMNKLTLEFKKDVVDLDDLLANRKSSAIDQKILDIAATLKPGKAAVVEAGTIKPAHFSGKVLELVTERKLGPEFGAIKRGEVLYLVRYTPEQMKLRPTRKRRATA